MNLATLLRAFAPHDFVAPPPKWMASRALRNKVYRHKAIREVWRAGIARENLDAALDRYFPADWPPDGSTFADTEAHLEMFLRDIRLNAECYPPLWEEAA